MVNYNNGKIYKIVCDDTNKVYYGSTTNTLSRRMVQHRSQKRCVYNEMTNPKICLVEDVPCERKEQLFQRERYFIENNECINKRIPARTPQEWRNDNKDKRKIIDKRYYDKNKEKQKEKCNCECGSVIRKRNMSHHIKSKKHINYVNSF